jgi:hypothetical protein
MSGYFNFLLPPRLLAKRSTYLQRAPSGSTSTSLYSSLTFFVNHLQTVENLLFGQLWIVRVVMNQWLGGFGRVRRKSNSDSCITS